MEAEQYTFCQQFRYMQLKVCPISLYLSYMRTIDYCQHLSYVQSGHFWFCKLLWTKIVIHVILSIKCKLVVIINFVSHLVRYNGQVLFILLGSQLDMTKRLSILQHLDQMSIIFENSSLPKLLQSLVQMWSINFQFCIDKLIYPYHMV